MTSDETVSRECKMLSENLRQRRHMRRLTTAQVAERSGIEEAIILAAEADSSRVQMADLFRICFAIEEGSWILLYALGEKKWASPEELSEIGERLDAACGGWGLSEKELVKRIASLIGERPSRLQSLIRGPTAVTSDERDAILSALETLAPPASDRAVSASREE